MKTQIRRTYRSPLTLALAAGALLSASSITGVAAQETAEAVATTAALPSAREVIDGFLAKAGLSKESLEKFHSQHTKGTVELVGMGIEGTLEAMTAAPNHIRVNLELGGIGTIHQGYDGKTAWVTHPLMGESIMEGVQAEQMRIEADYFNSLHLSKDYESMETQARETWEEIDCYKIRLVQKPFGIDGLAPEETLKYREVFEYFDVETGLMVGREGLGVSDMGDAKVTTIMSDYKKFGEFMMPAKTIQRQPGVEIAIVITSIDFNTVPEGAFALPASIKTLMEPAEEAEPEPVGSGN